MILFLADLLGIPEAAAIVVVVAIGLGLMALAIAVAPYDLPADEEDSE